MSSFPRSSWKRSCTRRSFLARTSAAVALSALPYPDSSHVAQAQNYIEAAKAGSAGLDFATLAGTGLEAAMGAGAQYADVLFRLVHGENWGGWGVADAGSLYEKFTVGVGVRALFNGYWGYVGIDGLATTDVMARLGHDATAYAKYGAKGTSRTVELAPMPVSRGSWTTPVEIDPFTQVSRDEKIDFMCAMNDYLARTKPAGIGPITAGPQFRRDDRVFASSEGAFTTQTLYTTASSWSVVAEPHFLNERFGGGFADFLTPAGAGWEYLLRAPYQDKAEALIEQAMRQRYGKLVDIGRYDVVFDACAMAKILDATIGTATELDRAMGFEANGVGTSFLSEPLDMLGRFQVGSALVNVSANRSMKEGAATVKWDDEGVEPADISLVTAGVLTDFQTTRESASWLKDYSVKSGKAVRSSGCAGHHTASLPTTQVAPNFVLHPGKDNTTFDDMVAGVKKGFAVLGGYANTDYQALNGSGRGSVVYEIRDGKLGETIQQSGYLFRTPEFWKNVVAIGGRTSAANFGIERTRDNNYRYSHTVRAVPATVTGMAIIDTTRKG